MIAKKEHFCKVFGSKLLDSILDGLIVIPSGHFHDSRKVDVSFSYECFSDIHLHLTVIGDAIAYLPSNGIVQQAFIQMVFHSSLQHIRFGIVD